MRAVLCHDFAGPDALVLGEIAAPVPRPEQLLVKVRLASVSFMDLLMVSGGYQMRPATPFVPGTEAVGIVTAVGERAGGFKAGDRVAFCDWFGGFGEFAAVDARLCTAVPDAVADAPAATLLHNYITAYYALVERAALRPGETVLVTGAAGGVGLAAVDLARHLGGRVLAGVGSDDKAALLRDYGVEAVINYRTGDLREQVKALTDGRGVDLCFDNLGGEVFMTMARLMNWGGRLMPIGFTSGDIPALPMNLPLLKNYSVVGVFAGAWRNRDHPASDRAASQLMQWLADGHIRPHVGAVMPLDNVKDAMRLVSERKAQGRTLLQVAT